MSGLLSDWTPRLEELIEAIRLAAANALESALAAGDLERVAGAVGRGAGDTTFGLDRQTERAVDAWFEGAAAQAPLSLFSEESGWRHRGPAGELAGFDHGGPRIVVDPVDGTRNLMFDLRPAWSVVALAGPGAEIPRQGEVLHGILAELPDSRGGRRRILCASRGLGCRLAVHALAEPEPPRARPLICDDSDRADQGYFPFFALHPGARAPIAELAADFFARLEQSEGAAIEHCFDDQYISSGGQLALVALGTYRMVVEARGELARQRGAPLQVCKPYDVAGAVLCAEEAGAVVTDLEGAPLDHALDADTPVSFCAFHNAATRARLWPHLAASLASLKR